MPWGRMGGVNVQIHMFLTLGLVGDVFSFIPSRFTPQGKYPVVLGGKKKNILQNSVITWCAQTGAHVLCYTGRLSTQTLKPITFAISKEKRFHTQSSTFNVYTHNLTCFDYVVHFYQSIATSLKCICALQQWFILYSTKECKELSCIIIHNLQPRKCS
jgi:hypothetical protein